MVRGGAGAMKVGEGGLWAMIERKLYGQQCRHKKPLPVREAVFSHLRYQNNLNGGACSFNGSFFAVCSFQPPPRALITDCP